MPSSTSDKASWYFRFSKWSNKISTYFLVFGANTLLLLARLLPRKARGSIESLARLLKNIALLIVQPVYIRQMMQPGLYLKVVRDVVIFVCPIAFASVFAALEAASFMPGPIAIVISGRLLVTLILCAGAFSILFGMLVNLLVLSGDFSFEKQDELQRTLSNQAATFTLHVATLLLVFLFLGYLFMRGWRDLAAVHISVLFFLARMAYLLKLLQLRWKEMAEVELADDSGLQVVEIK